MKKKGISTYITLLTLLSSMLFVQPHTGGTRKTTIEEEKVFFYQGTTISVDIFGTGKIFGGVTLQLQKSSVGRSI